MLLESDIKCDKILLMCVVFGLILIMCMKETKFDEPSYGFSFSHGRWFKHVN